MRKTNSKFRKSISILIILTLVFTCSSTLSLADSDAGKAATVFRNGIIYTVDGDDWDRNPVQSIAVGDDGKIMYVGSNAGGV